MATSTLLSLERFREILSFNPFHYWQLANPTTPLVSQCVPFLRQYAWQQVDAAGRNEVIEAIAVAEQRLQEYLGYSVAPHYVEATIDVDCFIHSSWYYPQIAQIGEGKLQKIATETWTNSATSAITSSDTDSDGLKDTFTATYVDNGAVTDLADVKLYFSATEQFIEDDLARWEIRPVRFKRLNATTIQVTGRYWLLVRPVLYEGVGTVPGYDATMTGTDSSGSFNPATAGNFATTVDFYVRTYTTANQITVEYDNAGTLTDTTVSATILNAENGTVSLGYGCSVPCNCGGWDGYGAYWTGYGYPNGVINPVQRLKINYRAGALLNKWDVIVARLAMAELARPICGCENSNDELFRWQQDMAQTGEVNSGSGTSRRIGNAHLGNPLGVRAGHIYAWDNIKHLRHAVAVFGG